MAMKTKRAALFAAAFLSVSGLVAVPSQARAAGRSFLSRFSTVSNGTSTVPANGDVNPYGVAVVRRSVGSLIRGDILVSNFNNSSNQQGTGTTIMQITPEGDASVFAQLDSGQLKDVCPGGIGLTTALVELRRGWVIVGSLPTTDGTSATAKAGCLLVLDSHGQVAETISGGLINGPWDMTAFEAGDWTALFVTNVLNGTVAASPNTVNQGTVVRIVLSVPEDDDAQSAPPEVLSETVIGSGFAERTDPAALVVGPTGVGLGHDGTLYVADTVNSAVQALPNALFRHTSAGMGQTVSMGGAINGPLGLAIAPNGDIIVANAGDGNMVEITPDGQQIDVTLADTTGTGGGTLFGLAVAPNHQGVYFVNDGDNTLRFLH
ncbi:MAG TPA: hypothetical protein VE398_18980 [Acidobacteriota bacterium]|nr:hypothetical protein [Acidobacteriota bacterium]